MAILTAVSTQDLERAAKAFGIVLRSFRPEPAGSVNTIYVVDDDHGARWFFRFYEEQDVAGAFHQARLLERLAHAGIDTPAPRLLADGSGHVVRLCGKPLSVFPSAPGRHVCQASVSSAHARAVGAALGRVHRVGETFRPEDRLTQPSRFSLSTLQARLDGLPPSIPDHVAEARNLLLGHVEALASWRPRAADIPLIHGDLFRDNVLFDGDSAPSLLDFESASIGGAAFDLAVTALAWCFGAVLDGSLVAALVEGYVSQRPLREAEIADLPMSARLACVRFATTRITDYELRDRSVGVYKDYRRWLARLAAVERLLVFAAA